MKSFATTSRHNMAKVSKIFYIGFAPPCQNKALLEKIWSHKPYLVPNSLALMPAALTAARPASLEARSTKTVPHNLMPKPKVPAYWDQ